SVGYKQKALNWKLLTSLLNACISQRRYVFMCSRRKFNELLAADKNIKRNSVNGDEFKKFSAFMLISKFIQVVRKPNSDNGNQQAGVYQLVDETFRELVSQVVMEGNAQAVIKDIEDAQMKQCVDIYENTSEITRQTTHFSTREYEREDVIEKGHKNESESVREIGSVREVGQEAVVELQKPPANFKKPTMSKPSMGRKTDW
ncbi:MAG: hypothetical protein K2X29_11170, partial [Candidatus Obscuribacterales bacterium]|nr:hypothetical protein [Candidatus Obscuribacterales bacterium]